MIQSSLVVRQTLFENTVFSGIGIGTFTSSFLGNVTADNIKKMNVSLQPSNLVQRFGLFKFYSPKQFEYEKNYFSDFFLYIYKNFAFIRFYFFEQGFTLLGRF